MQRAAATQAAARAAESEGGPSLGLGVVRRLLIVALLGVGACALVLFEVPSCPTAALFGLPCPGCGLTRATLSLIRGDVRQALHFHPLVWLLSPLCLALVAAAALGYVRGPGSARARRSWFVGFRANLVASLLLAAVLGVWVARFFGAFGGPVPVRSLGAPLLSQIAAELRR